MTYTLYMFAHINSFKLYIRHNGTLQTSHPIHIKRVEDLVHITISILGHPLKPEHRLQLKERNQA